MTKKATKKDGMSRFCVDFQVLNRRSKADIFTLPKLQEISDECAGGLYFTMLDFSGCWKIKMSEQCKENTAFVCLYRTLQFNVILFGSMNAPSTFQRMIDQLLGCPAFVMVFLDDVAILSPSIMDQIENDREIFTLVYGLCLKIKFIKCKISKKHVSSLGHIIDKNGAQVDPKIEVIQNKPPQKPRRLKRCLGDRRVQSLDHTVLS